MKKAVSISLLLSLIFLFSSIIIMFYNTAYMKKTGAIYILWSLNIISIILLISIIFKKQAKSSYICTDPQFEQVYSTLKTMDTTNLNDLRQKIVAHKIFKFFLLCFVILLIFAFSIINIHLRIKMFLILLLIIILFSLLISLSKRSKNEQIYIDTFKKNITSQLIKLINPNLLYNNVLTDNQEVVTNYTNAKFDYTINNYFKIRDTVLGKSNNDFKIILSDMLVYDNKKIVFDGIFVNMQIQNISNTIKIVPQNVDLYVHILSHNLVKIKMDSDDFESNFNIYSDNKLLTMQLLTSDTMELINDFYNQTHIKIDITIIKNNLYLRFYTGSIFAPKSPKDALKKDSLYLKYRVFKTIFDFSKKINENIKDIDL